MGFRERLRRLSLAVFAPFARTEVGPPTAAETAQPLAIRPIAAAVEHPGRPGHLRGRRRRLLQRERKEEQVDRYGDRIQVVRFFIVMPFRCARCSSELWWKVDMGQALQGDRIGHDAQHSRVRDPYRLEARGRATRANRGSTPSSRTVRQWGPYPSGCESPSNSWTHTWPGAHLRSTPAGASVGK